MFKSDLAQTDTDDASTSSTSHRKQPPETGTTTSKTFTHLLITKPSKLISSQTHMLRHFFRLPERTMEEVIRRSIQTVEQKKRSSVPWQNDTPHPQPFYTFNGKEWEPQHNSFPNPMRSEVQHLALYSWNIDFMLPFPESRILAAISHLKGLITTSSTTSTATVIFLQECVSSDLETIAADPWIRSKFSLTDIEIENWSSGHYGTLTLIDRRLQISSCFRVHYSATRMDRDGLFVDLQLSAKKLLRLCNTHLESLALEPPRRIPQMKLCGEYMRDAGVDAALLAGDLNAIQPFDRSLHSDNGLRDAFLELGGGEDDADGHTWGQQAATFQRERFGTSRMDKVFFCGDVDLLSFERFGAGVLVEDPVEREELVRLGFEEPWITDHLGVKAVVRIPGNEKPPLSKA